MLRAPTTRAGPTAAVVRVIPNKHTLFSRLLPLKSKNNKHCLWNSRYRLAAPLLLYLSPSESRPGRSDIIAITIYSHDGRTRQGYLTLINEYLVFVRARRMQSFRLELTQP